MPPNAGPEGIAVRQGPHRSPVYDALGPVRF